MIEYSIREAMLSDAESIAFVHVESWKTTYTGLMPEEILAARTIERRTQQWTNLLSSHNPRKNVFVAESQGRIVAYAMFGTTRWPDYPYTHELYAIYSLQAVQGRGIGSALIRHGTDWLMGQSAQSVILWALKENLGARNFYERLGGTLAGERVDPDFSDPIIEVAYGWEDIEMLRLRVNNRIR